MSSDPNSEDLLIGIWRGSQQNITNWIDFQKNAIEPRDIRGTFANNMKTPIHRWFRYAAGFSYDLVEESFQKFDVSEKSLILDPFVGVGTTSVCAKKLGIPSIGIELHPLISWIAKVKTYWDVDFLNLKRNKNKFLAYLRTKLKKEHLNNIENKPKLLYKCFSQDKLNELFKIKDCILSQSDEPFSNLCMLALISTLRKVSKAHTGWPYILPKKEKTNTRDVYDTFFSQLSLMIYDLELFTTKENKNVMSKIIKTDTRDLNEYIDDEEIDFAFTSPPYLNNFDYADRTRLELYFLSPFNTGDEILKIETWNDISEKIRKKLIVSVSHQAKEIGLKEGLSPNTEIVESVKNKLEEISEKLREEKKLHGGHKAYDIMIVAYFNDMLKNLQEIYRVLRPNSYYILILGDSAPYGIHIPTDVFIAKIGRGVGFSDAKIGILRKRGGKWKSAPKHNVPLRESMVILKK